MYVKPSPGLKVRDPQLLDFLPEEGREVPETSYWIRRVRDGDVVVTEAAQPKKKRAKSAASDSEADTGMASQDANTEDKAGSDKK